MMNCRQASTVLFEYVDGALDRDGAHELLEHVADCSTCARELEIVRTLDESIEADLASPAPPDLWPEVQRRISARASQRAGGWLQQLLPSRWHRAALAGSVVASVAAALLAPVGRGEVPSHYTIPVNTAKYGAVYVAGHEDMGAQTGFHDRAARLVIAALAAEGVRRTPPAAQGDPDHFR